MQLVTIRCVARKQYNIAIIGTSHPPWCLLTLQVTTLSSSPHRYAKPYDQTRRQRHGHPQVENMGRDEQIEEREVLDSIFPDEITGEKDLQNYKTGFAD